MRRLVFMGGREVELMQIFGATRLPVRVRLRSSAAPKANHVVARNDVRLLARRRSLRDLAHRQSAGFPQCQTSIVALISKAGPGTRVKSKSLWQGFVAPSRKDDCCLCDDLHRDPWEAALDGESLEARARSKPALALALACFG